MLSTGTSSSSSSQEEVLSVVSPVEQSSTEKTSIFATPPEPLFNHVKSGLCPELIQKSLQDLAKLNEKALNKNTTLQDCFITKDSTSFIFLACQQLKLPIEIQYRAIDLFVKFMSKHVTELYAYVQSTKNFQSPIDWVTVQDRLTHQVTLRAVTCIQLASKVSLHYKIVSIDKARLFLSQCDLHFTANSLTQSEIRVLKTLDYQVHRPTLLDHVETILEILGHNESSIPVKQLHGLCIKVLNIFYMTYCELEESLKQKRADSTATGSVTADAMLVSSSIVGTAAFILDPRSSDQTVHAVSRITCIESDDIMDFTALLIQKIITG